jgi:TrmH family RNA methyltransferase
MLSKNDIKGITRLKQKKYRQADGVFVVEGIKTIHEFLNSSYQLKQLYTTSSFNLSEAEETIISDSDLKKISFLSNPNTALAVFYNVEDSLGVATDFILALDEVNDPGNLGTIIRLCDWFGIKKLVCSENTVDCYNPKVIQATMGSLTRVEVTYCNLPQFLKETSLPVFGAFMDGENVYKTALPKQAVLVMGNEANGISKAVEDVVTNRTSIPRFGDLKATESLNVATATSILLSEFFRLT